MSRLHFSPAGSQLLGQQLANAAGSSGRVAVWVRGNYYPLVISHGELENHGDGYNHLNHGFMDLFIFYFLIDVGKSPKTYHL